MIASIANLVYELPHKLPNDLRLRILKNKETLRKSQIWMETSSFQKSNFGNGSQKTRKSRYKTFLVLFSFTGFLYFVPNILPRIVVSPSHFLCVFSIRVFLELHSINWPNFIVWLSLFLEILGIISFIVISLIVF